MFLLCLLHSASLQKEELGFSGVNSDLKGELSEMGLFLHWVGVCV